MPEPSVPTTQGVRAPSAGHVFTPPKETPIRELSAGMVTRFKRAYAAEKCPRIAIFLNRKLSDEVRQWRTSSRLVVSGELDRVSASRGAAAAAGKIDRAAARKATALVAEKVEVEGGPGPVYAQRHIDTKKRKAPPEDWMWQFEESFLREFLDVKAIVVDRPTIMRLAAAQSGRQGDPHELLSLKTVEMKALQEKADAFVEILVRRNSRAKIGYEFRASVKEVSTGRILANVTSLRWKQEELDDLVARKYKATSRGYVLVSEGKFPMLDRAAGKLALDVMGALARTWERQGK